jgi:hypothetical protein
VPQVNMSLLKSIRNSKYDESIIQFLMRVLIFEFERADDGKVVYTEKYDNEIKNYAMIWGKK